MLRYYESKGCDVGKLCDIIFSRYKTTCEWPETICDRCETGITSPDISADNHSKQQWVTCLIRESTLYLFHGWKNDGNTGYYIRLRAKNVLSQDDLAQKFMITRQTVSRWKNDDTVPNIDTLKMLPRVFNVSINTFLGAPMQLICQCCGIPLDDFTISKEPDGSFNEEYCKWCYTDGQFKCTGKELLIDFCVENISNENCRRNRFGRTWKQLYISWIIGDKRRLIVFH